MHLLRAFCVEYCLASGGGLVFCIKALCANPAGMGIFTCVDVGNSFWAYDDAYSLFCREYGRCYAMVLQPGIGDGFYWGGSWAVDSEVVISRKALRS